MALLKINPMEKILRRIQMQLKVKLLTIEIVDNSDAPIKEDSLNDVTEYNSDGIIEHLENNLDKRGFFK